MINSHGSLYSITVYFTTISQHVDCLFYLLIVVDLSHYKLPNTDYSCLQVHLITTLSLTVTLFYPNP